MEIAFNFIHYFTRYSDSVKISSKLMHRPRNTTRFMGFEAFPIMKKIYINIAFNIITIDIFCYYERGKIALMEEIQKVAKYVNYIIFFILNHNNILQIQTKKSKFINLCEIHVVNTLF